MSSELIINVASQQTRIALLENGTVAELFIELHNERGILGNIYKGRVVRVLPGMQVAFVDIGLDKAAFLYVSDVHYEFGDIESQMLSSQEKNEALPEENEGKANPVIEHFFPIEELLHEGQEILVQVSKDTIGSKGARITSHISLPGRDLVLMPTIDHVGISRRIEENDERKRLKEIIQNIKPSDMGIIVRTAGRGKSDEELKSGMEFLVKLWRDIQEKKTRAPAPSLVHQDLNITLRTVRDLSANDVGKIVIDSKEKHEELSAFIETFMPHFRPLVEFYEGDESIFDIYGIEIEIGKALGKKVWLKSGGYIVIEETEALTAIDVNTGKYVGKRNPEDTILKTNLGRSKKSLTNFALEI